MLLYLNNSILQYCILLVTFFLQHIYLEQSISTLCYCYFYYFYLNHFVYLKKICSCRITAQMHFSWYSSKQTHRRSDNQVQCWFWLQFSVMISLLLLQAVMFKVTYISTVHKIECILYTSPLCLMEILHIWHIVHLDSRMNWVDFGGHFNKL